MWRWQRGIEWLAGFVFACKADLQMPGQGDRVPMGTDENCHQPWAVSETNLGLSLACF